MKHEIPAPNTRTYQEWSDLIDSWIFDERARKMLKRKLLDGLTLEQVAHEFGYSTTYTKTIIYKYMDELFRHI